MKPNKEIVLASDALSPDGRIMAKCLMKENGLSIERLFNVLGEFQSDIIELRRAIEDTQYDIDSHIRNHD
jgi:hypothetical protein